MNDGSGMGGGGAGGSLQTLQITQAVNSAAQANMQVSAAISASQTQAQVGTEGHSPWIQVSLRRKIDEGFDECVMKQEKMKIAVVRKGDGPEKEEIKLWSEERSNDAWNAMLPFTVPSPLFMKPGAGAVLDALRAKVEALVRPDLEEQVQALSKSMTEGFTQGAHANYYKDCSFNFTIERIELKRIVYEGEPLEIHCNTSKLEEFTSALFFEFEIEVKQYSRTTKPGEGGCCAVM